jgi:hypothetical protein
VLLSGFYVVGVEDEVTVGVGDADDVEGLAEGELLADAVGVGLADDGEGVGDGVGLVVLVGCGRPVVGVGVADRETTVLGEADGVLEVVAT